MPHRLTPLSLVTVASSVWLVLATGTPSANAAEGNASVQEDALIKHGLELREKRDDGGALAEFKRAYQLSKSGHALARMYLSSGSNPGDAATASAATGLRCVPTAGWGAVCVARF